MKTHRHEQEAGKHLHTNTQMIPDGISWGPEALDAAAGFNSVLIKWYRRGNRWENLWLEGGGAERGGGLQSKNTSYKSKGWRAPPVPSTEPETRWGSAFIPVSSEMLPQLSLHQLLPLHPVTAEFTVWSERGGAVWTAGTWVPLWRIHISVLRFNIMWLASKENPCADLGRHTYAWRCKVFWLGGDESRLHEGNLRLH